MFYCRITKVKEFLKLVNFSEADGHLQQKLKQLLKLSKEKWEAACEHAKTAVQVSTKSLIAAAISIVSLTSLHADAELSSFAPFLPSFTFFPSLSKRTLFHAAAMIGTELKAFLYLQCMAWMVLGVIDRWSPRQ